MHQNMPNRGCNSQTSASPLTRVYRLHRQYTNTSDNPISTSMPQDKFQGQRWPQRPTQRRDIQLQGRHGRNLPPRETTGTVLRLHVDTVAHGPTKQEKNARPQTKNATVVGDLGISQKYADKDQTIKIVKRL